MQIQQFVTKALGDSSYLVVAGRSAAVVDPQRDVRPYLEAAHEYAATIEFVVETHLHNDYISGGPELAARGARIVAPAGAKLQFEHQPIAEGEGISLEQARLDAVSAPGHTHEHTAYLALNEDGSKVGAFTGGAILVGSAGRSDLLGNDHTDELTRLQWETAHRLAGLLSPDSDILPTHGSGSFCASSGGGGRRRSHLGEEKESNPVLDSPDFDSFRRIHLSNLSPIPSYYSQMAPINRQGATVFGEPPRPRLLTPSALEELDVPLVDVRSRLEYAAAHVPGSVSVEESSSQLAYLAWMLPFNSPLALITTTEGEAERITVDLFRIGFEQVLGYLPITRWLEAGRPLERLQTVDEGGAVELLQHGSPALDVRFEREHRSEPVPGAQQLPIDRFHEWADQVKDSEPLILCASGQRSTIVASFLRKRGLDPIVLVDGGASDLRERLDEATA
ncbi:MAG TPA: rhodanese-like domain-containing protein [Dehalococcoidia bacterium]|nr:rhodanese-like domain-containing protein [Dehalococcoidia bacterium]